MRVLVIGGGGREHALAWKLASSPRVSEVLVAPGNAGTAREAKCRNLDLAAHDIEGLTRFARDERIDLTVVGPEIPLGLGLVDRFVAAGLRCFGPLQSAAQLETSKAFAKDFLARHRIPTAQYRVFESAAPAHAYVDAHGAPVVVKADGLAAGKGVVVAQSLAEAHEALERMFEGDLSGAGARVVIEDFLAGEEASFIVVAQGSQYVALASAQDHKALLDGDTGPNTGGMGAYSPAPVITPALHERICREIIEPTLQGMIADGRPFGGFLYAGLMIDDAGNARVLEFNTRLGDPEAQPLLMRLDSDLSELLEAALDGRLDAFSVRWHPEPALGVVLAAAGYPNAPRSGDAIEGLELAAPAGSKLFHAGTLLREGQVLTQGGRVLCACALGQDLSQARQQAYALVSQTHFAGAQWRTDIGHRALARGNPASP